MPKAERATDFLQILKAVLATTVAWWICVTFLDSEMPFLAPWVALMTIQATVASSVAQGAQTMVASFIGVLMSFVIGVYLEVNIWTYALDMDGVDYEKVNFKGGVALVVGSEGEGVSRLVVEHCDQKVSLPMAGHIDSLNASVAAGVMMYRVLSSRKA